MRKKTRRFGGLLMAVFAGHLGLVSSGAVCVRPGMAAMTGSLASSTARADEGTMSRMPGMDQRVTSGSSDDEAPASGEAQPAEQGPCSQPATGQCLASMACVTVLGSNVIAALLPAPGMRTGSDASWAELMPASSSTAPELPPPRA